MPMLVVFLLLPVVTFVALAMLPRGRPALVGIVVAALTVASLGPVVLPEDGSGFGSLLLWVFGGAVALAALVQALRLLRLPGEGGLPYRLLAVLLVLFAAVSAAQGMF